MNDAVIAVKQHSHNNEPLFDDDGLVAWAADLPDSTDKYLALFNGRDGRPDQRGLPIELSLERLGFSGPATVHDLWSHQRSDVRSAHFRPMIAWHGAR